MKAIRVEEAGGPEVMQLAEVPMPEPGEGEVLVKIAASGLNYIDTYQRSGQYPMSFPVTLGLEAAGVVEAVGNHVTEFAVGDRVAYSSVLGAYAEYAVAPAEKVVPAPDAVDLKVAAAIMLQGMTAHYLTQSTYPIKPGDTVLIHAAAGGMGLLLVQLAKQAGATVIGTVSTEEKEQLSRGAGADHIIRYTEADFEEETMRLTEGAGVEVVYDSVGKTTFDKSLNVLKPLGYLVLFGQASGAVPPVNPAILMQKGSLFLTRPSLFHYVATRDALLKRAGDVFEWIAAGQLDVRIGHELPLAEATEAHRMLTGRKTTGKVLLIP